MDKGVFSKIRQEDYIIGIGMTEDEKNIRDCFAYFGRTIYMAQCVEKGIMNSLISSYKNITKTRYDELLLEKSQLTLGQLKREIKQKEIFSENVVERIEIFHKKRDWLAHNYWWDRAIEFNQENLRYKIFEELDQLTAEFESLNEVIEEDNKKFLLENGVNIEQLVDEFSKLDKTPTNPSFRRLMKDETLLGIYLYPAESPLQMLIFMLEDSSYWTLCESGLTFFNLKVELGKLEPLDKTIGIFPIKQFNPKPKTVRDWEYNLDLKKNGLFVKVQPNEISEKFMYKWEVKKHR